MVDESPTTHYESNSSLRPSHMGRGGGEETYQMTPRARHGHFGTHAVTSQIKIGSRRERDEALTVQPALLLQETDFALRSTKLVIGDRPESIAAKRPCSPFRCCAPG